MNSKTNKKKERKLHLIPASVGHGVVMLITILAELMLIALMLLLDVLPGKYFIAIIAVIILADIGVFALLNSRKTKTKKRTIGTVLCVIMILGCGLGTYYMFSTYRALDAITGQKEQVVEYDVIVLKNSAYSSIEDIQDQTVYAVEDRTESYKKAKAKLQYKVGINIENESGCMNAGEQLVTYSGTETDNVLFMSAAQYGIANDIITGFKKKTKVIYRIKIPVSQESSEVKDVTRDSFNMLVSGVDTRIGITDIARSDVNMIVTVNPKTHEVLLTSMPRDSYVPLHMNGEMDKLTHTGVYGIDETVHTIEDWLKIDIDYYARVDFDMAVNLIDAVGGIDVYNNIDFYSSVKGWHYKKGWHHMQGRYALWFLRERKTFKDEDEQRIRNQQKVMKALIKKVTSKKTIVANYTDILKAIEGDMQTSMSREEISRLAKMQLNFMPEWKIKRQWVDGVDAYRGTWSMGMDRELFVSLPKEKSVEKVTKTINEVMNQD